MCVLQLRESQFAPDFRTAVRYVAASDHCSHADKRLQPAVSCGKNDAMTRDRTILRQKTSGKVLYTDPAVQYLDCTDMLDASSQSTRVRPGAATASLAFLAGVPPIRPESWQVTLMANRTFVRRAAACCTALPSVTGSCTCVRTVIVPRALVRCALVRCALVRPAAVPGFPAPRALARRVAWRCVTVHRRAVR